MPVVTRAAARAAKESAKKLSPKKNERLKCLKDSQAQSLPEESTNEQRHTRGGMASMLRFRGSNPIVLDYALGWVLGTVVGWSIVLKWGPETVINYVPQIL